MKHFFVSLFVLFNTVCVFSQGIIQEFIIEKDNNEQVFYKDKGCTPDVGVIVFYTTIPNLNFSMPDTPNRLKNISAYDKINNCYVLCVQPTDTYIGGIVQYSISITASEYKPMPAFRVNSITSGVAQYYKINPKIITSSPIPQRTMNTTSRSQPRNNVITQERDNVITQFRIDTIYYNEDLKGVSNRSFAAYYMIAFLPGNSSNKKIFQSYYISGDLFASGGFISIDKSDYSNSVFDGQVVRYYKNGMIKEKTLFTNGKLNGESIEYYEDGLIKRKSNYVNGELSGLYTEFFEEGNFAQAEFMNGQPKYDYYVVSNQNGQLVKMRFSDKQPIWESPSVSERQTEYQDGRTWQYYVKNGLTVSQTNTLTNEYGKWHKIEIVITNNSYLPVEFDPETDISAYSVDNRSRNTNLQVFSFDNFTKKVRRAQNWAAVAAGLAEGIATANAGYNNTTTYYSGNSNNYRGGSSNGTTYTTSRSTAFDAAAVYRAQIISQNRMVEFANYQLNIQNALQQGYLRRNTINPGQTIAGYVNIQRVKGHTVVITIKINNADHIYSWTY